MQQNSENMTHQRGKVFCKRSNGTTTLHALLTCHIRPQAPSCVCSSSRRPLSDPPLDLLGLRHPQQSPRALSVQLSRLPCGGSNGVVLHWGRDLRNSSPVFLLLLRILSLLFPHLFSRIWEVLRTGNGISVAIGEKEQGTFCGLSNTYTRRVHED